MRQPIKHTCTACFFASSMMLRWQELWGARNWLIQAQSAITVHVQRFSLNKRGISFKRLTLIPAMIGSYVIAYVTGTSYCTRKGGTSMYRVQMNRSLEFTA